MSLTGKTALVTGGARGIGRAIATRLAAGGARVIVCDMQTDDGSLVVDDIRKAGGDAHFLRLDVSDPDAHVSVIDQIEKRWGGLDIACNNAGITGEFKLTADQTIDSWRRVIDVNLSGMFYGVRAQIPAMLRRKGGSIVNTASALGLVGRRDISPYVAAKHGVIGLTKSIALEYGVHNIRCNAVAPAVIKTDFLNTASEERLVEAAQQHALGRIGNVHEVAEVVAFLADDAASFLTGSVYPVDGGYLAA
ncbi:SDR family oxidoreductase [Tardiphaga alba]|uniref:SDR family oxidoreductase n=1 Tax=Tardiphaga alba TaxID=340268 RepID=A0ABX8AG88_9BRAD|nr:SDR family NAD(P)-dependent oxidoreductase [Tardiphaga alba]QUS41936.1 SDR family oxidoreductase [Tardiphaga alba]